VQSPLARLSEVGSLVPSSAKCRLHPIAGVNTLGHTLQSICSVASAGPGTRPRDHLGPENSELSRR